MRRGWPDRRSPRRPPSRSSSRRSPGQRRRRGLRPRPLACRREGAWRGRRPRIRRAVGRSLPPLVAPPRVRRRRPRRAARRGASFRPRPLSRGRADTPAGRAEPLVEALVALSDVVVFSAVVPGRAASSTRTSSGPSTGPSCSPTTSTSPRIPSGSGCGSGTTSAGGFGRTWSATHTLEALEVHPALAEARCEGAPLPLVHPGCLEQARSTPPSRSKPADIGPGFAASPYRQHALHIPTPTP